MIFVYHCFDRIVIHGYLSGLSRPEQVVHFFRKIVGVAAVTKEVLSARTADYQNWVEAFARNHRLPIEWAEKGVRKEDHVLPWLRRMTKNDAYGVYFIFKSMEQGSSFRVAVPKYPTADPNYRILAHQRSRFTHYYFYIRDEVLGPLVMRVASFFPFQTTYYLNGHSFIEQELSAISPSPSFFSTWPPKSVTAAEYALTRLRQSSASSFAARLVEPTRSQNITVIGRRSADRSRPLSAAAFGGETVELASGFSLANAAIASSSRNRSPRADTPMSLRPASVSRGSRSASILLSLNAASYWPSPRLRSQDPTSMVLHLSSK